MQYNANTRYFKNILLNSQLHENLNGNTERGLERIKNRLIKMKHKMSNKVKMNEQQLYEYEYVQKKKRCGKEKVERKGKGGAERKSWCGKEKVGRKGKGGAERKRISNGK